MTWATSVPIVVFPGVSVLDLGPMYATDVRQTDVRQRHRLMPPAYSGLSHNKHWLTQVLREMDVKTDIDFQTNCCGFVPVNTQASA